LALIVSLRADFVVKMALMQGLEKREGAPAHADTPSVMQ